MASKRGGSGVTEIDDRPMMGRPTSLGYLTRPRERERDSGGTVKKGRGFTPFSQFARVVRRLCYRPNVWKCTSFTLRCDFIQTPLEWGLNNPKLLPALPPSTPPPSVRRRGHTAMGRQANGFQLVE
ncbi:unnamed protein product [Protopolystoma xenopodis]|uniref:Uncharacterized protein n=1 Tax=Protopolystoma xenopodis TaxID=117903 RepID=A0A3S5CQI2_9PLAT|nr:unnamed protein product [Protopolystoma xenopodis]